MLDKPMTGADIRKKLTEDHKFIKDTFEDRSLRKWAVEKAIIASTENNVEPLARALYNFVIEKPQFLSGAQAIEQSAGKGTSTSTQV